MHRAERAVDGPDHVGDGDVAGGLGEEVAALGTAPGLHDAGGAQRAEDVLAELEGSVLRAGELPPVTGVPGGAAASSAASRTA